MGISSNAHIAFGVIFDEEFDFPWGGDDFEEWYLENIAKQEFKSYEERFRYLRENPIPVLLENYCSSEYPICLLAVRGTVQTALRGDPTIFDPSSLVADEKSLREFATACEAMGLEIENPSWVLYSYMG